MKGLIACEYSGRVREAFRKKGHDVTSCDFLESEIDGKHYKGDVTNILYSESWDFIISHPTCTRLCNSGVLRLYNEGKKKNGINPVKWQEMIQAAEFFKIFLNHGCGKIVIENPIMHGHAKKIIGTNYSQTIQPYEHGEPESKRTCLWIKGLPLLKPTNILIKPVNGIWNNQTASGQNRIAPGVDRWKIRSRTYQGIANAFAEQWG